MSDPWGHFKLRCTTGRCEWAAYVTVVDDPARRATAPEFRALLREHCDQGHRSTKKPTGFVVNLDNRGDRAEIVLQEARR